MTKADLENVLAIMKVNGITDVSFDGNEVEVRFEKWSDRSDVWSKREFQVGSATRNVIQRLEDLFRR